jgi:acetolactate synthase small subunit
MPDRITPPSFTLVVELRDHHAALLRLVSLCQRRGWTPATLAWQSDGGRASARLVLVDVPARWDAEHIAAQVTRLIDVLHVSCEGDGARRLARSGSTPVASPGRTVDI